MGGLKVAIVGTGQLGALLATRIPANTRKVIIAQRKTEAVKLADEVGGIAAEQLSAVRGCDVIFLAAPSDTVAGILQEMQPHLKEGALVVNMAADLATRELMSAFPAIRFAAAKVIGHAWEMAHGSPGVIVLDYVAGEAEEQLRTLLAGLGAITADAEEKVLAVNTAVVEAMIEAEAHLRERLQDLGLEDDLVQVAITTTGPGVLRSLSGDESGSFAQQVAARLRAVDVVTATD